VINLKARGFLGVSSACRHKMSLKFVMEDIGISKEELNCDEDEGDKVW